MAVNSCGGVRRTVSALTVRILKWQKYMKVAAFAEPFVIES
jgi:hypothetical protein